MPLPKQLVHEKNCGSLVLSPLGKTYAAFPADRSINECLTEPL